MSTAISVNHLSKNYKITKKDPGVLGSLKSFVSRTHETVEAVKNVSFEIEKGDLVGFIGPNGAGKTTTLKCLSGLLYPDSGNINILDCVPHERKHEFLRSISFVSGQKSQLWWNLPPQETFLLNKTIYDISDQEYKKTLDYLVETLNLGKLLKTQVRKLSLGQRMRCELVASLIHKPSILFLDEPTIGLDVVMQERIRSFISSYNRQQEATIILTSHYMRDVEKLCKNIIVIDHGKIIFSGKTASFITNHKSSELEGAVQSIFESSYRE